MGQSTIGNYQPPGYLESTLYNQDSFSSSLISSLDHITYQHQHSLDTILTSPSSPLVHTITTYSSYITPIVICYIIIHWVYSTRKKKQQLENEIHMRLGNELGELNREIQDREDNLYYKPKDPCDDDDDR